MESKADDKLPITEEWLGSLHVTNGYVSQTEAGWIFASWNRRTTFTATGLTTRRQIRLLLEVIKPD